MKDCRCYRVCVSLCVCVCVWGGGYVVYVGVCVCGGGEPDTDAPTLYYLPKVSLGLSLATNQVT